MLFPVLWYIVMSLVILFQTFIFILIYIDVYLILYNLHI